MFQIDRPILAAVALDEGSADLLKQADALARGFDAALCVCHVLPEIFAVRPLFPQLHLDDALKLAEFEASIREALLRRIRGATNRDPSQVKTVLEQGSVHAGILRAAESIDAGLIVVGGATNRDASPSLGGSAEQVVRYAHCPVLVARPSQKGKVLVATDFSDPALPAVEAAAAEAHRRGAELVIIHVMELLPLMLSAGDGVVQGALPIGISEGIEEISRERLDECVRRFEAKGGGLMCHGLPAQAILHAAKEIPAELLVIGTHGRTGLSRLLLGSVAEALVRSAPCSTLVVRLG